MFQPCYESYREILQTDGGRTGREGEAADHGQLEAVTELAVAVAEAWQVLCSGSAWRFFEKDDPSRKCCLTFGENLRKNLRKKLGKPRKNEAKTRKNLREAKNE